MTRPLRLIHRLSSLALAAGVMVWLAQAAVAAAKSDGTWFGYGQSVGDAWDIAEVEGDPLRLSVRRKGAAP